MSSRVLGVLGGRDYDLEVLRFWLAWADHVYAADSGADRCLENGVRPIVVGDLDSMKGNREGLDVRTDLDQDRSDTDKLFDAARSDGATGITIIGFEGDRFDHELASLSSAAASGLATRIVLRRGLGFVGYRELNVDARPGQRLSVVPISSAVVTLTGVQWPLEKAALELGRRVSLSNRATGPLHFQVESGVALLVMEQDPTIGLRTW